MIRNQLEIWSDKEHLKKIKEWAKKGMSDFEIAQNIGIDRITLYRWKKKSATLSNALMQAHEVADQIVENSMFKTANGFSETHQSDVVNKKTGEVTRMTVTTYYPPNVTAQMFWLKNRKAAEWKDKVDFDATVRAEPTPVSKLTTEQLAKLADSLPVVIDAKEVKDDTSK